MPMTESIVALSEEPARLSVRRGQLVIEHGPGGGCCQAPACDSRIDTGESIVLERWLLSNPSYLT